MHFEKATPVILMDNLQPQLQSSPAQVRTIGFQRSLINILSSSPDYELGNKTKLHLYY